MARRAAMIWLLTAILLCGAALRIAPLTDNRFHPDEALFATLGRLITTGQDPLLADTALLVDKPPLFYYTLAGSISICWGCELTARLPGLLASVFSIALVARIAYQLWQSEPTVITAAGIFALSPLAINFAPTAFADPQMMMWLLAALAAISARRAGWGGFFFGLAFATKENALFALPLIVVGGFVQVAGHGAGWRWWARHVIQFCAPILLILASMVLWETARGSEIGFWDAALRSNNPGRLIRSGEVLPRLVAWWDWTRYVTGESWSSAAACVLVVGALISELRREVNPRQAAVSFILAAFGIGYFAFHWLIAFPVLDRYMLVLAPIFALLIGRSTQKINQWAQSVQTSRLRVVMLGGLAMGLIVVLIPASLRAMRSGDPVGGDHGAFDGIDAAAEYLRMLPDGSIIYHNELGWTLSYYLFDAYVVPVVFDTPAALARDLEQFGDQGGARYLVLAGWSSHEEIIEAVDGVGFRAEIEMTTSNRFGNESFVIYRLVRGGLQ